ncbi:MAG: hypothetical protein F4Y49_13310 [Dehalococcoidia bacterium]|nr:hypothetical protein [Dehalococcoidia bacterium]
MVITRARADIEVRGADGNIALLVEIKGMKDQDDEWLAEYRRNLAEIILVAPTAYFMIVMADYMYLWKRGNSPDLDPPDYRAPTAPLLSDYAYATDAESLQSYTDSLIAGIVCFWLNTLVLPNMLRKEKLPELEWVFESGLYDRIRFGSVHRIEDPRWR